MTKYARSYYQGRLLNEVVDSYIFARHTFSDLDAQILEKAYKEAKYLASSNLFDEVISPSVSIDHYGEFTFSHKSNAGYVDIGVRGEGELSYHIRNDIHPPLSSFDDYEWSNLDIPRRLIESLQDLAKNLRELD